MEVASRTGLGSYRRVNRRIPLRAPGLRIAPPEAPKTGYRFGKGVYFADVISKSGGYCFTSNQNPTAVMLVREHLPLFAHAPQLAEVALGKMNELLRDEYMEKPPPGHHSTKAMGGAAPDPKHDTHILDKVKVPVGKVVKTGIKSLASHNEYIVYGEHPSLGFGLTPDRHLADQDSIPP